MEGLHKGMEENKFEFDLFKEYIRNPREIMAFLEQGSRIKLEKQKKQY